MYILDTLSVKYQRQSIHTPRLLESLMLLTATLSLTEYANFSRDQKLLTDIATLLGSKSSKA